MTYLDPYRATETFPLSEIPPRPPVIGDAVVFGGKRNACAYEVVGFDGCLLVRPPHWEAPSHEWFGFSGQLEGSPFHAAFLDDSTRAFGIVLGYGTEEGQWLFADDHRAAFLSTLEWQLAVVRSSRNRNAQAPFFTDNMTPPPCESCEAWPCRELVGCPDWLTLAGIKTRRGFISVGQVPLEQAA